MSVLANVFTRRRPGPALVRLLAGGLLAAAAAALVSCGSSSKGLIPLANAGPLQSDFEAVAQAAQSGDGNCAETEAKINATERDFAALPSSIDAGLHQRLEQGVKNLRERALALCAQPITQTNTVRTTPRTATTAPTTTTTTTPPTTSTPTTTTQTTPSTPAPKPPNTGGGTVAPGGEANNEGAHGGQGAEPGAGQGGKHGGGQGAGQENGGAGESGGAPAGGQEAGK